MKPDVTRPAFLPARAGPRLAGMMAAVLLPAWAGCLPPLIPAPSGDDTVDSGIQVNGESVDTLLDRYTDTHLDPGSDMRLLTDGPESLAAFEQLINSAEQHIHIETLNFDDDMEKPRDIALEVAQLLAAKARQGVRIRMIVDPVVEGIITPPTVTQALSEANIEILGYVPMWTGPLMQALHRTHKKLILVDGKAAIIGGMNYGWLYLGEGQWRDTNALLTGPVVATMQAEFLRDWAYLGGNAGWDPSLYPTVEPAGSLGVRSIDQRPFQDDFDINNAILIALRSAKQSIAIETPYFNPTGWMLNELTAAAGRGVRITLLTNTQESTDIKDSYTLFTTYLGPLIDSGVHVFLWGQPRTLHSKALVVDNTLAMIGSYNLNWRSIAWDTENVAVVTDAASVTRVRAMIEADMTAELVFEVPPGSNWLNAVLATPAPAWLLALIPFF
ncbi:MAG: phosphatidylserine/phosphatidylglycerophosphate/cardiolipin synthase family protein [Phycisphaerae bacterium]|nr:phosphatidylserine/phosphatidylglycerophosphate/cardiolipin synthase family protein [Phycisphaerae bacterium]